MASIRKTPVKGGVNWQVRWREDGREQSETLATYDEATTFRGLVDANKQHWPKGWVPGKGFVAEPTKGVGLTLREWFPVAIASRVRASAELKVRYQRQFDRYVPDWIADVPMHTIAKSDAGRYVVWLREQETRPGHPISGKTAHNIFGTISSAVKQAVQDGKLERNPFVGQGTGLKGKRPKQTYLEVKEFELIRSELKKVEPLYADLATFLFWTGMRFGEATALTWGDLDYARQCVTVDKAWKRDVDNSYQVGDPKTDNSVRKVALYPDEVAMLRKRDPRLTATSRREVEAADSQLMWPNAAEGGRLTQSVFYQVHWLPAVGNARLQRGLTKLPRVHDLRHSHASHLLSNGADILAVSRRLGHSSVAITGDTYGHLTDKSGDVVLASIAAARGPQKAGKGKGKKKGKKKAA